MFSNVIASKLILSLKEWQVRSLFDSNEDEHKVESSSDSKSGEVEGKISLERGFLRVKLIVLEAGVLGSLPSSKVPLFLSQMSENTSLSMEQ